MSMPDRARKVRPLFRTGIAACVVLLTLILAYAEPARAIINGKPVTESDAYAHAVVGVVPLDKYDHPGACTGILLTPRAVLTAAHCVSGDTKSVSVVFDLKIGVTHKVAVTRSVVHPEYKDEEDKFKPGDIAIIFLAAHDYPTVIIPFDRDVTFNDGQQFVFLGYGRSIYDRSNSTGVLRKAAIAAAGSDTAREVTLKPLMDAWPCGGDSGGPILRKDMSGRYALTGIMNAVSAGPVGECLFENSFMTPVHSYADWIASTLASEK
jgi:secreted trypsin-like serine protease